MPATVALDLTALQAQMPKAPKLPPPGPGERVVRVKDSAGFTQALAELQDGTTILLADGVYPTPGNWVIKHQRVTVRSESGNRDKVIFDGGNKREAMLSLIGGSNFTIADLTFFNCELYGFRILGDSGVRDTNIHNVKFHNIWTRGLKGTHPQRPGDGVDGLYTPEEALKRRPTNGLVRYCLFLCDTIKPWPGYHEPDYISGIDMMGLKNWEFSDNLFVGIRGINGGGRGAIFIWVGSEDVRAERNLIVNCDRGISFGNPSGEGPQVTRGIVRHNRIVGAAANKCIEMCGTVDSEAAYNTVYATHFEYAGSLHFFQNTKNARCHHNAVHGHLNVDAETRSEENVVGSLEPCFANPLGGDLRLTPEGHRRLGDAGAR